MRYSFSASSFIMQELIFIIGICNYIDWMWRLIKKGNVVPIMPNINRIGNKNRKITDELSHSGYILIPLPVINDWLRYNLSKVQTSRQLFFLLVFKVSLQNAISQNPKQANNPQNTKNQVAKSGLTATRPGTVGTVCGRKTW